MGRLGPSAALLLSMCTILFWDHASGQLTADYYNTTCPNVDEIVRDTVVHLMKQSNVVAPSALRLFVHDCLVLGCDASILISSTEFNVAERDFVDNQNIPAQAFSTVFLAKEAVEHHCPGIVSCADILAMVARDVVFLTGGPMWEVLKGRRDGLVSQASSVEGQIPSSNLDIQQQAARFESIGLTLEDLVILAGAHSIGFAHCDQVMSRLYNFNSTYNTDPSMDVEFATQLEKLCPLVDGNPDTTIPFDFDTSFTFDNKFYLNLLLGRGLLFSDQVLFTDNSTRSLVFALASSQNDFFQAFSEAMVKLSAVGVKTGPAGEVRRNCAAFNE